MRPSLMSSSLIILASDSNIGRVHIDALDMQTRMEILVSDLHDSFQRKFRSDSADCFMQACKWDGVRCDPQGKVIAIDWGNLGIEGGSMSFEYLPETVENFSLDECIVEGALNAARLPPSLKSISLRSNQLGGSVDFDKLPNSLKKIFFNQNEFQGTIDFEHLPASLEILSVNINAFSGSAVLTSLPATMQVIRCEYNQLSGSLDLTRLPSAFRSLRAGHNRFSGEIVASRHDDLSVYLRKNAGEIFVVDKKRNPACFGYIHL